MKKLSLLIGNDINNIDKNNKWKDIIDDIIDFCKIKNQIIPSKEKSFPLLYEEVFIKAIKKNNISETNLKEFISDRVNKMKRNEIHKSISEMNIGHIMTTNYEFLIEGQTPITNKGIIKERIFSIFRHFNIGNIKYWHIHGDCNSPDSINLGFEHYGGQLQHIRNYLVSGTHYKNEDIPKKPFIKRFENNDINYDSWIDLFFTHDIHIFGLKLDFVEIDLWWLITYRARQIFYQNRKIKNKIYYYYPSYYEEVLKPKIEILESMAIETISIKATKSKKEEYYNKILNQLK